MTEEIVDIHTHIYPEVYLDHLAGRDSLPQVVHNGKTRTLFIFPGESGRIMDESYWSVAEKVAHMDRLGITQSVVSLGNPWLEPFGDVEGMELAIEVNEFLAGLAAITGGRVVGMGCLPNGTIESVVETIRHITMTAGLYGAIAGAHICNRQFDDPALDPIWSALEESGQPLLVHPHYGLALEEQDGYGHMLPLALGFPYETTVALVRLAAAGVLDRHPGLRVIGSHGGGTVPYLAGRLDGCWAPDQAARALRNAPPSTALSQLYLDALVYHPRALHAAVDLVGVDHMMFGTDHPFAIFDHGGAAMIRDALGADAARLLSGTAKEIFGLPPAHIDTGAVIP